MGEGMEERLVKAGTGHAFLISKGDRFRVVDVEGRQVSDLVVFRREDFTERFSPGNTRKLNGALKLTTGGVLYSTKCRGLLRITRDTVGEHDFLYSSCSPYDYAIRFGLTTPHNSCLAILTDVLAPHGVPEHLIPDPFNIFQRTLVTADWRLESHEALSGPGDHVEFQAEDDCLVALTSCPQDQNPINGWKITDILVRRV
jgi:uncharacterized protein